MKKLLLIVSLIAAALAAVPLAGAAIIGTYVDATLANTDNAAGGAWVTTTDSETDNLWRYPATSPHGSWDVFYNRDAIEAYGQTESAPTIVTTLTGLTPGSSYDIRLLFGSQTALNYSITGGLSAGSLTVYDGSSSPLAVAGTLYYEEGYMNLYQPLLGTAIANASGEIKAYVAANSSGNASGRALYDGIAYDVVPVPEPAALSLLLLGGLALAWRRR